MLNYSKAVQKQESFLRRFLRHLDIWLVLDVLILCALGLLMIYSASARFGNPAYYLIKQFAAFALGLFFMFVLAALNYQIFAQNIWAIFAVSLSLLVMVLLFGKTSHGAKSWIFLGPVMLQPAEISKLLAVLVLSSWCEKHWRTMRRMRSFLGAVGIVLAHIVLILLQPDFGSTLVYFPILTVILFAAGAPLEILLPSLTLVILTSIFVLLNVFLMLSPELTQNSLVWQWVLQSFHFSRQMLFLFLGLGLFFAVTLNVFKKIRLRFSAWMFWIGYGLIVFSWLGSSLFVRALRPYQLKRLVVFFNPQIDPMGSGYHVIQSIIALGSGKILGKGLFSGTQGQLGFLPEQHTDFIFSVLGEELGFVVGGTVVLLYALLVWRALTIAQQSRDIFGSLVALGIGTMFAFYAILNLAMVMGMAPVTGLPLPFFSYGGSSLLASLAAVGILLSIRVRRYMY